MLDPNQWMMNTDPQPLRKIKQKGTLSQTFLMNSDSASSASAPTKPISSSSVSFPPAHIASQALINYRDTKP